MTFTIPEREEGTEYLEFAAVGDTGTGGATQRAVGAAMAREFEKIPYKFVLLLGDNFYQDGVDSADSPHWRCKFYEPYAKVPVPFYVALGNHDHDGNPEAQIQHESADGRWKLPDYYYSFSYSIGSEAAADFFVIDTELYSSRNGDKYMETARLQNEWLAERLKKSTATWKIVAGHHPLLTGGFPHKPMKNREKYYRNIAPLLAANAVDLYISGHAHGQELLVPGEGAPESGTWFAVAGAGAKSRDIEWTESTRFADPRLGFAKLRLSKEEMVIEFIVASGETVFAYRKTRK